MAEQESDGQVV